MSLRVNLLREEEFRYQGPVSRKFIGRALIGTVLALLLLFILYMGYSSWTNSRELAQLKTDWSSIEGRYKELQQKKATLNSWMSLQKELKPWGGTRVDWGTCLDELQGVVSPLNQLTRLSVRGDWEFIKPPPPPPNPDGSEAKPLPATPARRYSLEISGRAAGTEGEDAAIHMVDMMKVAPILGRTFETPSLKQVLRDASPNETTDRSFEIAGQSASRKLE